MNLILNKIKSQIQHNLPFVVFCKPNSKQLIAMFQRDATLQILDENSIAGFAFVSFDGFKKILIPEINSDLYFENLDDTPKLLSKLIEANPDAVAKSDFEKLVQFAIKSIENESLKKVVVSRKQLLQISNFNIETTLKKLFASSTNTFRYLFFHPEVGMWMGASPERLLSIQNQILKSVSLAGTQVCHKNERVIWQQKEQDEQQIVTDFLQQKFEKLGSNLKISEAYTQQAGNLIHLKTDLQVQISNDKSIFEITNLLHPTPAVCGYPTETARDFILKNENYNREFYSGYCGEWKKNFGTYSDNETDLYVNLRCMKIEHKSATFFAGCGVTVGSNPEKEFLETQNKMQTMKSVLF